MINNQLEPVGPSSKSGSITGNKIDSKQANSTFYKGLQGLKNCFEGIIKHLGVSSSQNFSHSDTVSNASSNVNVNIDHVINQNSAKMGFRDTKKAEAHGMAMEKKIALRTIQELVSKGNLSPNSEVKLKKQINNCNNTIFKKNDIGGFNKLIAQALVKENASKVTLMDRLKNPITYFLKGTEKKQVKLMMKKIKNREGDIGKIFEKSRFDTLKNQEWKKYESNSFLGVSGERRKITLEFANKSANQTSIKMGFSCRDYETKELTMSSCAANKTKHQDHLEQKALANDARSCLKTEEGKNIIDIQTHSVATAAELEGDDREACLENKAKSFIRSAITTELRKCAEQNGGNIPDQIPPLLLDIASHSLMSSVKGEEYHFMKDQKEVMEILKGPKGKELLGEVKQEFSRGAIEDGVSLFTDMSILEIDTHMTQHGVNEGEWYSRGTHEKEFNQYARVELFKKADTLVNLTTSLLSEFDTGSIDLDKKINDLKEKIFIGFDSDKKSDIRELKFLNECKRIEKKALKPYLELKQEKMTKIKQKIQKLNDQILRHRFNPTGFANENNIFELPVYEAMLANECGMHICINCMSGKDRTGEMTDQLMMLADKMYVAKSGDDIDSALNYLGRTDFKEQEQKAHKRLKEHSGRQIVTELNTGFSTQKTGAKAPGGLDKILSSSVGITKRDANFYGEKGKYGHEFDRFVSA